MRYLRHLTTALICASGAYAQNAVSVEDVPPQSAIQHAYGYTGSNLIYICYAASIDSSRNKQTVAIASATNASPVVFTVTGGHKFATDGTTRPSVTIAGGTGTWTAASGTYAATILSSTTFSVPVNSTAFGAVAGSLTFVTTAPRQGRAEWAVLRYTYDGSSNMIGAGWDNGSSRNYTSVCAASTTSILQ